MSAKILMYESDWCGYCRAARRLLDQKGLEYESRLVDGKPALRAEMRERSGRTSVPQIFFGEHHVGGYDDLAALESDGTLETLLGEAGVVADGGAIAGAREV